MTEDETIEAVISDVVRAQFSDDVVHSVSVIRDVDDNDAVILRVTVVLSMTENGLNRKRMVGLVRHIRSKLEDIHVTEFPLISYVSKSDAAKLKLETT